MMNTKKRCIFHYPNPLDYTVGVGSAARPCKILESFKKNGYIVDEITGYGKERKKKINGIKKNMEQGLKYDFLYSECLTYPTLLSEKNHFPLYPFLDFAFFKHCKKRGIPIGLFYRDAHWLFDFYRNTIPWYKRVITIPLYYWDLHNYKKYVSILYVPSKEFGEVVPCNIKKNVLPPGCDIHLDVIQYKMENVRKENTLNIFYVGGIEGVYDPLIFMKALQKCPNVFLTVCVPKEQWEQNEWRFHQYVNRNIRIVHEKGDGLAKYYKWADISVFCTEFNEYVMLASPIKCKETIGFGTPMIVSDFLLIAEEIVGKEYGWAVDNDVSSIKELLDFLIENPDEINTKTKMAIKAAKMNTWDRRTHQISTELINQQNFK